jgi:hypothetical protein
MKLALSIVAGLAIVAVILAPFASAGPSYATTYDFEDSVAPWMPGDSVAPTRDMLLLSTDPGVTCASDQSLHYAQLTAQGQTQNEIVWLATSLPADGPVTAHLSWLGHDVANCSGNCTMAVFAGAAPPMPEDFQLVGPMGQLWTPYAYSVALNAEHTLYVAIGIQVQGVNLLPGVPQAGIDCVTIQVDNNGRDHP